MIFALQKQQTTTEHRVRFITFLGVAQDERSVSGPLL